MSLQNTIASLSEQFAAGILQAIRKANLDEILAEGGRGAPRRSPVSLARPARPAAAKPAKAGKGGRLARRSPSDIEHVIGMVVAALGRASKGMRSEELQKVLKLSKQEITKPIAAALATKKISKKGQRRATTYFAK